MAKQVTVYTSDSCPYCTMVTNFLHDEGVAFTEVNLSEAPERIDDLLEATGQFGVPQTEIDGEWILGYDPEALKERI